MNKNINRIIRELENDPAIQAMHRDNIEKRQALRERRRALMLARMHGRHHNVIANVVGPDDERRIKIEAIKRGIWEKYNGDTVKALLGYIPHLVASGFNGKFNQEFDNLFHEAINEIWEEKEERRREEEEARREILWQGEEKEVYILSNGKKTNDFLEWAQDRINARKAVESGK